MPDVPSDEHQLLLPQQHIRASGQIVQLTPVDIDQLKRLVLFAAKIKIAGALLIKKCVKPLQLQFAPRAGEFLRRVAREQLHESRLPRAAVDLAAAAERRDGKPHARPQRKHPVEIIDAPRVLLIDHQQRHTRNIVQHDRPVRAQLPDVRAGPDLPALGAGGQQLRFCGKDLAERLHLCGGKIFDLQNDRLLCILFTTISHRRQLLFQILPEFYQILHKSEKPVVFRSGGG